MGYKEVTFNGQRVRTNNAPAPRIAVSMEPNDPLRLELIFEAAEYRAGESQIFWRVTFPQTLEYRWIEFNWEYFASNDDDFEFSLIEIVDSGQIEAMIKAGPNSHRPVGQRMGGVLDERDVHHYRIGFDDYGTFDIIALGVEITNYRE